MDGGCRVNLQTVILKWLISLLDLKLVLTLESHIFFDWKFKSSPTYTPRFAHATPQFQLNHFGYNFKNFGVDDYVCTQNILHTIW